MKINSKNLFILRHTIFNRLLSDKIQYLFICSVLSSIDKNRKLFLNINLSGSSGGHGSTVVHYLSLDVGPARVVEVVQEALHGGGGCAELPDPGEVIVAVLALALSEPLLLGGHGETVLDAHVETLPGDSSGNLKYLGYRLYISGTMFYMICDLINQHFERSKSI